MLQHAIYYHPDTVITGYTFDTTRKGDEIARQLTAQGWHITQPPLLDEAIIADYHSAEYIAAVQTGEPDALATSQGFEWDVGMWKSVRAQVSSMLAACMIAASGGRAFALSAGFHHARKTHGAGFCTLNGLVIGCGEILKNPDANVIILDVDAHHGGGTYAAVHQWERVTHVDISTSIYDTYRCADQHHQRYITDATTYLTQLEQLLHDIAPVVTPQTVLLYNAGVDIHEQCIIGGLTGITDAHIVARERLVSDWAHHHNIGIAACLAGGYHSALWSPQALYNTHINSITTLLQAHI